MRAAITMQLFSKPTLSQIKNLQKLSLKKKRKKLFCPIWLCKCLRVLEAGTFIIIFNDYTKTLLVPQIATRALV